MIRSKFSYLIVLAMLVVISLLSGCPVDTSENASDISNSILPTEAILRSPDTVVIRFRNLTTSESVQVEFFATNQNITGLPDALLDVDHQVTQSIGFAGTGILQPGSFDLIEFPCTPSLSIGTSGGNFVDFESGEPRGRGVARWAQEGPLALCGAAVSFDFAFDGTDFTTALDIFSTPE
jgi:hypothetical protein